MTLEREAGSIEDVPGLMDHIFPDEVLPRFKLLRVFFALSSGVNPHYSDKQWYDCPELTRPARDQALRLATCLNGLRVAIGAALGETSPWRITGDFSETDGFLPGLSTHMCPDIITYEGDGPPEWKNVGTLWDIAAFRARKKRSAGESLSAWARLVFEAQDDRRFVLGISVEWFFVRFHVFDRAGVVSSQQFSLHSKNDFLRLFTGLLFSDKADIGYDPTIKARADGTRVIETVNGEYTIVRRVFCNPNLCGRGTICWHVTRDGKDFVIKDYWAKSSQEFSEPELLNRARDIEGIPSLVSEEVVQFKGEDDSTDRRRSLLKRMKDWDVVLRNADKHWQKTQTGRAYTAYVAIQNRLHRRLVMTPFAIPLTSFRTKKELIGVFIDAIEAHRRLLEVGKILHRDISVNNIMIQSSVSDRSKTVRRSGLLIDLDHSAPYHEDLKSCIADGRLGTRSFMAFEVLSADVAIPHRLEFDLESFFYVLIWICIVQAGPNGAQRHNLDWNAAVLKSWCKAEGGSAEIARNKIGAMINESTFETFVIKDLAPYFLDLTRCLLEWRAVLFPAEHPACAPATYEAVLRVLRECYERLPEEERWCAQDDPVGYGLVTLSGFEEVGKKRKREECHTGDSDDEISLFYSSESRPTKRAKVSPA